MRVVGIGIALIVLGAVGFLVERSAYRHGADDAWVIMQTEANSLRDRLHEAQDKAARAWSESDRFYSVLYGNAIKRIGEEQAAAQDAMNRMDWAKQKGHDAGYLAGVVAAPDGDAPEQEIGPDEFYALATEEKVRLVQSGFDPILGLGKNAEEDAQIQTGFFTQ